MRICIHKATGKLLESQSDPFIDETLDVAGREARRAETLETLRRNAIESGYKADEIEVRYCDDAEHAGMLAAQIEAEKTYAERRRAAYPSIGDQLDALWTGGAAADEMRARVMAVKAEFPEK